MVCHATSLLNFSVDQEDALRYFQRICCRESGKIFRQNAAVNSKALDGADVGRLSRFIVNIAFSCSSTELFFTL